MAVTSPASVAVILPRGRGPLFGHIIECTALDGINKSHLHAACVCAESEREAETQTETATATATETAQL